MARPRNFTVVMNGKAVSVTPRTLKAALSSVASGAQVGASGKDLGKVVANLDSLTSEQASALLASMFPAPVAAPLASTTKVEPEDLTDAVELKFSKTA